jgi:hypothetical protein
MVRLSASSDLSSNNTVAPIANRQLEKVTASYDLTSYGLAGDVLTCVGTVRTTSRADRI